MITTKKELKFYMAADLMMNKGRFRRTLSDSFKDIVLPNITTFLKSLRKVEYYSYKVRNEGGRYKIALAFWRFIYLKLSVKFGFSIFPNTFGYGLMLPHHGTIVVGADNRIGNYALINVCTCITQAKTIIGDGLFMGTGAVISGHHILRDNVIVCANAVVTKDSDISNITIGGVPAKILRPNSTVWYKSLWPEWEERVQKIEELRNQLGLNI